MNDSKEALLEYTRTNAEQNGYFVCPDQALLDDLIDGLAVNQTRYGYPSCPCRVGSGNKVYDADIVCPCEYRDADCDQFGMCYCGLYVSKKVHDDPSLLGPIPERRPKEIIDRSFEAKEVSERTATAQGSVSAGAAAATEKPTEEGAGAKVRKDIPVWRCTVCGYLAARETPPAVCPICKAKAERFERFDFG